MGIKYANVVLVEVDVPRVVPSRSHVVACATVLYTLPSSELLYNKIK